MTPIELLDSVKLRFPTLLHDDPAALEALLIQALGVYQDKAGASRSQVITEPSGTSLYPVPAHLMTITAATDGRGDFVSTNLVDGDAGQRLVQITPSSDYYRFPITVHYLMALREVDLATYQLPAGCVTAISDYLETLIAIPNCERLRRVQASGKLDTSDIPDANTLYERRKTQEEAMAQGRAILPMVSIYPIH